MTLIDRFALISNLTEKYDVDKVGIHAAFIALDIMLEILEEPIVEMPQQEQNKAQWIEDGYNDEPCVCSRCGQPGKYEWCFCPNCGAEMEEK